MTAYLVARRSALFAGTIGALLAVAPAGAQQPPAAAPSAAPAAPALPPGSPLLGRPDNEAAMKLAPVAPPPLPAAADKLPVDQAQGAEGLQGRGLRQRHGQCALDARRRQGHGVRRQPPARQGLRHHRQGRQARGQDASIPACIGRTASPSTTARSTSPSCRKISKVEKIEDNLDNPPKPTHGLRRPAEGRGARLEVHRHRAGQQALCPGRPARQQRHAADKAHGQIRRINLDGSGAEVVALGVRNTVGFDWHPVTKELYFTDNGRDWLSEDLPNDELNRVTKTGQHFGSPYC